MAEHLESVRNLAKDIFINIFAGLVGAGLVDFVAKSVIMGLLVFILILIASLSYLLLKKYKRLFKLLRTGGTGFYYSFDLAKNEEVMAEARNSLCYLGISSNSILEYFKKWIVKNPSVQNYTLLLMDPESPVLKKQIAFEKGVSPDIDLTSLDTHLRQNIENEAALEKKRIENTIDVLKNLQIFKEGKLKIGLYRSFTPWWMYIVDDKKIYLGILEKGRRGQDSPVMLLSRHPDFTSPFDPFKNHWDSLWAESQKLS